jgi:hypothetical protein
MPLLMTWVVCSSSKKEAVRFVGVLVPRFA